jgi:plastocyanin
MRKSRVWMAVVVALGAVVVLPAAQAQAWENVPIQFGDPSAPTVPQQNSIAPAELRIHPGDTVTFNINGFHQPLAYRLRFGESFEEAFARLDARADQINAAGLQRQWLAGEDTFVTPITPPPDRLSLLDVLSGYVFLGPTKVPPPLVNASVTSPPALPGRYVLLCNVRSHYRGVFDGKPYSMRSTLVVG